MSARRTGAHRHRTTTTLTVAAALLLTLGAAPPAAADGWEPAENSAPVARLEASPPVTSTGAEVVVSAAGSTDAETPDDLAFAWDAPAGATEGPQQGPELRLTFAEPGSYDVGVEVSDPEGATSQATVEVLVADRSPNRPPTARMRVRPRSAWVRSDIALDARGSRDHESPTDDVLLMWNFHDGGGSVDATGPRATARFTTAGVHRVTLTAIDPRGASSRTTEQVQVRREIPCQVRPVFRRGSWRTVHRRDVRGGSFCRHEDKADPALAPTEGTTGGSTGGTTGETEPATTPRRRKASLSTTFHGPRMDLLFGVGRGGGRGILYVDGHRLGKVSFAGRTVRSRLDRERTFTGLGAGGHRLRLVVRGGTAWVEGFAVWR